MIRTAAKDGHSAVVVCSAGFVADHLEVLYDLDIEAKEIAEESGLRFVRTEMPNVDERFIAVLADVVRSHLAEAGAVNRPARVVVVGGGITGLVAAYRLTSAADGAAPVQVTLVESSPRLGGKVRTGDVGGLLVETGPDSFVVRKPWAVDLATELGLGPDLIVPGASGAFVWARGRLVPFPIGNRVRHSHRARDHRALARAVAARQALRVARPVAARARPPNPERTTTNRSGASSTAVSVAKRRPSWPARSWPASTRATRRA